MSKSTFNVLKKIGYLIRFHRRRLGMTQSQMASEVGLSFRNFQRLENGEVEPKLETLNMLATYMGISITSLIRPTCNRSLFIREASTQKESKSYDDSSLKSMIDNDDLRFAQQMIHDDYSCVSDNLVLSATLDGSKVLLSDELAHLTGITEKKCDIDNYIAIGSSMERWEYIFRSNIKKAYIQNFYFFPNGFKVFEENHYNLKPNPEAPTSECSIRDVTARHELESWLKLLKWYSF